MNEHKDLIELGKYVQQKISEVIKSFDDLISLKNEHDKAVYRVIKNEVLKIRVKAGEDLIDSFSDSKLSSIEKEKLKINFEEACLKIIKHNLKERKVQG